MDCRHSGGTDTSSRATSLFLACITLLIAALLWGSGNLANKTILYDIDPVCAVFLRSSIAALALLWPAWCEQAGAFPNGWVRSILRGSTVFALALLFQKLSCP
jgi:drug/metabolite transporter (DMT)-like permease